MTRPRKPSGRNSDFGGAGAKRLAVVREAPAGSAMIARIGIDIGGTFTDIVLVAGDGRPHRQEDLIDAA